MWTVARRARNAGSRLPSVSEGFQSMINMDVEAGIWRRAEKAKAIFHVIHDAIVSELDGLLRESIPHAANNRALMKDLWSLRLTILQTLLPLNAPQLGLTDVL